VLVYGIDLNGQTTKFPVQAELPIKEEMPANFNYAVPLTKQDTETLRKYVPLENCAPPAIVANAVIRYNDFAKLYIQLENKESQIYLQKVGVKENPITTKSKNGEWVFLQLELNKEYEILGRNSCGRDVVLTKINTAPSKSDALELSENLYTELSKWSMDSKGVRLSQFLSHLSSVNYYERLYFYQMHLLKGEFLKDNLMEGSFPDVPTSSVSSQAIENNACSCTYIMKIAKIAFPGTPWDGQNFRGNSDIYCHCDGWLQRSDFSWNAYSAAGPAKWQQLTNGGHCGEDTQEWLTDDSQTTNGSPYYAAIGFNLFCTNFDQVPETCDCEKTIPIAAKYFTKLDVSASAPRAFGWCWGNRGATAAAEDWAVLVEHNLKTGGVTALQAGKTAAIAECSSSLNKDFFIELSNLALKVGVKLIQLQSSTNGSGTLNGTDLTTFATDLGNSLKILIQTPAVNRTTCTDMTKEASLITYNQQHKVKPNNPMEYVLFSFSALRNRGYTRWSTNSRIISEFMLAGILNGAASPNTADYCCSAPTGVWISETIPDLPSIRPAIQYFFDLQFPGQFPVVNTDYGLYVGNRPFNCLGVGEIAHPGSTNFLITNQTDGVLLTDNTKNLSYNVVVSDVMGRIVYQASGKGDNQKIWDYKNEKQVLLNSGIYFVQVTLENGQSKTLKLSFR
jgi:hypothetical protein